MINGKRALLNPARVIVLGFLAVIAAGALLLALPVSARGGAAAPFLTALFTSASATCVTGLTVADTALTWSAFGQAVILCLIQIGGLGFMSVTTIFFFIMNRKIDLSRRLLIVQSLSLKDIEGVVRLIRHVLIGTFAVEGLGALVLWSRFAGRYGLWKGLWMGVFHSVSAFCNAGFDLLGGAAPFSSLTSYSGDPFVAVTVMLLVFAGGLGFFVWEDILRRRRFRNLHLHSKLVLAVSFWLIAFGWVFFFMAERGNPDTIGGMTPANAALASLFQAVMPRSGGFSVVDQASLRGVSKFMAAALMFIGGSAGSTAGGIKNTTAGILVLSAVSSLRGKSRLSVFGRTIPAPQVISALSIMVMVTAAVLTGSAAIALIQPGLPFSGIVSETVSAIATCGLTHGITPALAPAPLIIIMLYMFFGRVGIMTLGMAAFLNRNLADKTKYPDTWVMMG
ncbi:MAG: potassium uptake protein, TrkH family [Oscillospiraceae bacterium]|nr:potassium uptake protein, TrkH family [Oscillospiraceae bacterium]